MRVLSALLVLTLAVTGPAVSQQMEMQSSLSHHWYSVIEIPALLAAVVFGCAMALQFVVQAMGWSVRYELVLMIPYALTQVALGAFWRGSA